MKRASVLPGRLSIILLLLYSVVFFPRVSEAGPVGVEFYHPFSYGDLEFGPDVGFAQIADGGLLSGYPEARLSGPNGSFEIVEGTINLVERPPSRRDALIIRRNLYARGWRLSLFRLRSASAQCLAPPWHLHGPSG